MWLSDRRTFLTGLGGLGALALGGCGFTPAYGPNGAANRLQGSVLVDAPVNRDDYLLVQQLEDRLGRGDNGRYALGYTYVVVEERMAITADNITTRFNLVGRVSYALRDRATDAVLIQGGANSFTGYSATGSTVATLAASRDARARLATLLADQMVTRLIATSAGLPG